MYNVAQGELIHDEREISLNTLQYLHLHLLGVNFGGGESQSHLQRK